MLFLQNAFTTGALIILYVVTTEPNCIKLTITSEIVVYKKKQEAPTCDAQTRFSTTLRFYHIIPLS